MKKFAICLNGNIKCWDNCKASFINNILEKVYPVIPDIFIHLYSRKTYKQDTDPSKYVFELSSGEKIAPKKIIIKNEGVEKRNVKEAEKLYKY